MNTISAQEWMSRTLGGGYAGNFAPVRRIVGITGKAGSGKDTAASYLRQYEGYRLERFAGPLKAGLEVMFGLSPSIWDDRVAKEETIDWLGCSPRYLAQTLGTEWGRQLVDPDVWVKLMEQKLLRWPHNRFVVSDVRFNNEADMLRDHGGMVLHIERPGGLEVAEHTSEHGVDFDCSRDRRIVNDGTVADLHKKVMDAVWVLM